MSRHSIWDWSGALVRYSPDLAHAHASRVLIAPRFYPSLSAISTHFRKYRGTALGIAFAGSGVGGVIYPIMFRKLFVTCGFPWGVRIAGFISLALCTIATFIVSSRLSGKPKAPQPLFDMKNFKDLTFMLLVLGGVFVSLGKESGFTFLYNKTNFESRPLHPQLLHCLLLDITWHLLITRLFRAGRSQRRWNPGKTCPTISL